MSLELESAHPAASATADVLGVPGDLPVPFLLIADDAFALRALLHVFIGDTSVQRISTHVFGRDLETLDRDSFRDSLVVVDCGEHQTEARGRLSAVGAALPGATILALVGTTTHREVREIWSAGARAIVARNASSEEIRAAAAAARRGLSAFCAESAPFVMSAIASANATIACPLSPREHDVVVRLCQGRSNSEIGRELSIAESTVKSHLASVMVKWSARDRLEVALTALRAGVTSLD